MFHFLYLELRKILRILRVQQEMYQPNVCKTITVLCSIWLCTRHILLNKSCSGCCYITGYLIRHSLNYFILISWLINLCCFRFIQSANWGRSFARSFRIYIKFESSTLLSPQSANPCLAKKVSTMFTKHRRFNSIWLAVDGGYSLNHFELQNQFSKHPFRKHI